MDKRFTASTSRSFLRRFLSALGRSAVSALCGMALLISALSAPLAYAGPEDDPSGGEMMVDVFVARPIGLVTTVFGAAAFIVSLPFSALGGNIDGAADKLVIEPARETFVRCLGCRQAGHPDRFKGKDGEIE